MVLINRHSSTIALDRAYRKFVEDMVHRLLCQIASHSGMQARSIYGSLRSFSEEGKTSDDLRPCTALFLRHSWIEHPCLIPAEYRRNRPARDHAKPFAPHRRNPLWVCCTACSPGGASADLKQASRGCKQLQAAVEVVASTSAQSTPDLPGRRSYEACPP